MMHTMMVYIQIYNINWLYNQVVEIMGGIHISDGYKIHIIYVLFMIDEFTVLIKDRK